MKPNSLDSTNVLRSLVDVQTQLSTVITKIDNLKTLQNDLKQKGQSLISKGIDQQLKSLYVKRDVLNWVVSCDNGAYDAISLEMISHVSASLTSSIKSLEDMKECQAQEGNWQVVNAIKLQLFPLYVKQKWLNWLLNK